MISEFEESGNPAKASVPPSVHACDLVRQRQRPRRHPARQPRQPLPVPPLKTLLHPLRLYLFPLPSSPFRFLLSVVVMSSKQTRIRACCRVRPSLPHELARMLVAKEDDEIECDSEQGAIRVANKGSRYKFE